MCQCFDCCVDRKETSNRNGSRKQVGVSNPQDCGQPSESARLVTGLSNANEEQSFREI